MRPRPALSAAIAAAVVLTVQITGCASQNPTTVQSCFDWPDFEEPDTAADAADAVALGRIIDQEGTTSYYEVAAATWNVSIDEWIEGGSGETNIVVTSVPRGCGDTDDTMAHHAGGDEVVLFLRSGDDGWETLTPFQGIVDPRAGGGIPATWPPTLYDD